MNYLFGSVLTLFMLVISDRKTNGRVITHTFIPVQPQYTTQSRQKVPYSQSQMRLEPAQLVFMKHLLELDCLRETYNQYQLSKQLHNSQHPGRQPNYFGKTVMKKRGNGRDKLKAEESKRENYSIDKNIKYRYLGNNEKILLTPIGAKPPKFPIYIYKRPQKQHPIKHSPNDFPTDVRIKRPRTNATVEAVKDKNEPSVTIETAFSTDGSIQTNDEELKKQVIAEETFNFSPVIDTVHKSNNKSESVHRLPIPFGVPTKRPLPEDYKFSKFSQFPEKLPTMSSLFSRNVSGDHKWFGMRPQFRPYEVEETIEENVRVDVNKEDDPLVNNKRKPQSGVGGDHIASQVPIKFQTKPKPEDTFELLQSSIGQILKGLMGSYTKDVQGRLRSKQGNDKQPNIYPGKAAETPAFIKNSPSKPNSYKTSVPYPFETPLKRNFPSAPVDPERVGSELSKHPDIPLIRNDDATNEEQEPVRDYKEFTTNLMLDNLNTHSLTPKNVLTTSFTPEVPFNPAIFAGSPRYNTKGIGRELNLSKSTVPLPDLFKYSEQQEANESHEQILTSTDMSPSYYEHTQEMMFDTSHYTDSGTSISLDPFTLLLTETVQPDLNMFLQMKSTSSVLPELIDIVTTTPTSTSTTPESDSTTKQTEGTTEKLKEGSTALFKEFDDPLTIDLLATTLKPDSASKNGRKLNFEPDSDDGPVTNLIQGQRRSDILIGDAFPGDENAPSELLSTDYIKKMKETLTSSGNTIDDVISFIPSVVDDLRQNKIQSQDLSVLSQAFGKYWSDILALSKDSNLDMLPLLKMKKEKDLKNLLENFLLKDDNGTAPSEDATVTEEDKVNESSAYDYIEDYKDLYDEIIRQDVGDEKVNRFRHRRGKSLDAVTDGKQKKNIVKRNVEERLRQEATKEYFDDIAEEQRQLQKEDANNYIYEDVIYDEITGDLDSLDFALLDAPKLRVDVSNKKT